MQDTNQMNDEASACVDAVNQENDLLDFQYRLQQNQLIPLSAVQVQLSLLSLAGL